jgi:DNA-directed RNA polymerase specialized sigma24 family protein
MPEPEPVLAPPERPAGPDGAAGMALDDRAVDVLYALALRITGSSADAEDVVADAVARGGRDEPPGHGLDAALIRRCRELALVRSGKRLVGRARARRRSAASSATAGGTSVPDLEALRAAAASAFERLPAEARLVLDMVYFEGHTRADAAASLGLDRAVASARLRRACAALRAGPAPARVLIALGAPAARAAASLRRRLAAAPGRDL